jgi:hypothetical protein
MLSFKMFAAVTAMMIVAVSAAGDRADLVQAAAPVGDKAAVHAAASGAAEASEKANIAANGMASSVHDVVTNNYAHAQQSKVENNGVTSRELFKWSGDVGHLCFQCYTNRFSANPPCCSACEAGRNSWTLSQARKQYCKQAYSGMACKPRLQLPGCLGSFQQCVGSIGIDKPACIACVGLCAISATTIERAFAVTCAVAAGIPGK